MSDRRPEQPPPPQEAPPSEPVDAPEPAKAADADSGTGPAEAPESTGARDVDAEQADNAPEPAAAEAADSAPEKTDTLEAESEQPDADAPEPADAEDSQETGAEQADDAPEPEAVEETHDTPEETDTPETEAEQPDADAPEPATAEDADSETGPVDAHDAGAEQTDDAPEPTAAEDSGGAEAEGADASAEASAPQEQSEAQDTVPAEQTEDPSEVPEYGDGPASDGSGDEAPDPWEAPPSDSADDAHDGDGSHGTDSGTVHPGDLASHSGGPHDEGHRGAGDALPAPQDVKQAIMDRRPEMIDKSRYTPDDGHYYATRVFKGGRPDGQTVFSGHGYLRRGAGEMTVPSGTTISFYVPHGELLPGLNGLTVEAGIYPGGYVQKFHPGEVIPDYTLDAPAASVGGGFSIMEKSTTVSRRTFLSELLKPGMGDVHWAACREIEF
ncbi:hypothetical protein FGW37_22350 [Streptomyces rectiverticillatus]|uniref:putative adhesin n=1 Tax=Streptomyces rectiverticillatus TaxID=173860 RepID=UPI0015C30F23|nr:hypothetical protein [Streptomyces rectiverticillatus]QLE73954.1 hypothetical protein FGW37_22350 [Streptomyces rectiverticillatus]